MAGLADTETQKLLREIIRAIANMDDRIRKIVREEITDMRTDIKSIKLVQGQQSVMLRATQADLSGLKSSYRKQAKEVTRLGGLFEDFEHRFEAAAEVG